MTSDRSKFVELYVRDQRRLYGYIVSLLPRRQDAEDVFQETSIILWEKWDEFDPSQDLMPWAFRIAQNVARNYVRKHKLNAPLAAFDDQLASRLAAAQLGLQDELAERRQWLDDCLGELKPEQRKLIEQHYLSAQPMVAMAQQLQVTPNSLYIKLNRVRKALTDCMTRKRSAG